MVTLQDQALALDRSTAAESRLQHFQPVGAFAVVDVEVFNHGHLFAASS